jgi:hypothetical protein
MFSTVVESKLTSITAKIQERDAKECFCSSAEAEGMLVIESYPFSMGSGSVSMDAFGLPIFFKSRVLGVALSSVSTDVSPLVNFEIQHVSVGGTITVIDTFVMDGGKFSTININSAIYEAGQIAIKIKSVQGLVDEFAKYRVAVYLQAEEDLTIS